MNRTIILLGFADKDEAIRKRNSGFMDAILAKTDWDIPIFAAALRLLGKVPGRDVTIVGYDNKIQFNGWSRLESYIPPLTVDKCNGEIGHRMAARLLMHIEEPESWRPENILVAPGLVETESQG